MRIFRLPMIVQFALGFACIWLTCWQTAEATSGWDRHDQVIADTFRIHGSNGSSVVERRGSDGQFTGPPLLDIVDHPSLHGPPDYAQIDDQVLLRYQWHGPRSQPRQLWPVHFVVPYEQGDASGPFSLLELQQLLDIRYETLHWRSPDLPAAWPLMVVLMFTTYWPWLLLGCMLLGLACWARLAHRRRTSSLHSHLLE